MEFDLICINCKNYNIENNNCKAFSIEIPYEIYVGLNDHSKPLPNQGNDITFEQIEND